MIRGFSQGNGSIRLFQVFGIQVFLHWSWFLVALYEIETRQGQYSSVLWNAIEYLALFVIVLMHEFGHALACRSVGGQADRIVLWPLGGVAFVSPPQRPGAMLWSIVAGPLVNVVLFPLLWFAPQWIYASTGSLDAAKLATGIFQLNFVLLVFNMLPIYPLDGGKILWSLLWFLMGRGRALRIAGYIGIVGAIGFVGLAVYLQSVWIGILAAFGLMQCWTGLKASRTMDLIDTAPRHLEARCPACGEHPMRGPFWRCGRCGMSFDTFETRATCPRCFAQFEATSCAFCGQNSPIVLWFPTPGFPMQAPPPPTGFSTIVSPPATSEPSSSQWNP